MHFVTTLRVSGTTRPGQLDKYTSWPTASAEASFTTTTIAAGGSWLDVDLVALRNRLLSEAGRAIEHIVDEACALKDRERGLVQAEKDAADAEAARDEQLAAAAKRAPGVDPES